MTTSTRPHRPTRGVRSPLAPHGTPARGTGRPGLGIPACPCRPCRDAKVKADALRALANLSGNKVRVPAPPVAAHLRELLAAGMGWTLIARTAGCSSCTIARILNGQELMRRSVADRILSVQFQPAPGRTVDATGTRRRVQALMAIGYSIRTVAREAGVDPSILYDLDVAHVRGMTHDRIASAYDRLRCTPPEGARPSSVTTCRLRAQREGWPDPLWWEDMGHIDDPDFDPAAAEQLKARAASKVRHAEIAHLAAYGIPEQEIASRLGLASAYVHDLIRDMRKEAA